MTARPRRLWLVAAILPVALHAQRPFPVRREAIEWTDSVPTRAIMWSPTGQPGELPTLLFSPGFGQVPSAYSRQVSAWASRGFVVIAITHPFIENPDHAELYDVSQLVSRQLVRALDHIVGESGVWVTTGGEIAEWYYSHYYDSAPK